MPRTIASILLSLARGAFKQWQDAKERERGEWGQANNNYRNTAGVDCDIDVDFGPDDIIPTVVEQFTMEWQYKFDTFAPVPNSWVEATLKEKLDEELRDLLMADQMNEPEDDFSLSYCYDGVLKGTHRGTLTTTALSKFHSLLLPIVRRVAQQAIEEERKEAHEEKHQEWLAGQPKVDAETGEIILADQTDCIVPYDLPLKGRVVVLTGAFQSYDDLKRRLTKAGALHSETHPHATAIPYNWDYLVVATFASQMYGGHDKGSKHEQYQQIKAEGHHCLMISENTLLEHLSKAA